jgi:YidC/Oxa1 family membrane protein insertase
MHPPTHITQIEPQMKEIQAKYKSDPQTQQQKMAQLYSDNNVNPLAGCLPALVQIPIFISLYRALTNLAAQVRGANRERGRGKGRGIKAGDGRTDRFRSQVTTLNVGTLVLDLFLTN